ncbi:TetR/AcrR family transcriptional regulator [soil metagenome]
MTSATAGRQNQRTRTRKDLLDAASRLLKQGLKLTVEEVAAEAMVSRATAYRYFPNVDMLVAEVTLEWAMPDPADIFLGAPDDPVERLIRVDDALTGMMKANESAFRTMLAQSLQAGGGDYPVRANRRTALIEEALTPARDRLRPADLQSLMSAVAVFIGVESMVVFTDVLRIEESRAREARRWAIRALVEAALTE